MRNIWFFVGWILLIIGLLELAAGVYGLFFPSNKNIKLTDLHANLWWGILITLSGAAYLLKNRNKYIEF
jgi:hypothetical protein